MSLLAQLQSAVQSDVSGARRRAHMAVCQSKLHRFVSKSDAKRYCKLMVRKGADPRVRCYECPACRYWHLTRNHDRIGQRPQKSA